MGVVVRRYVYRYPHNKYYFSLLHFIRSFLAAASLLLLCSFLNVFLFFYSKLMESLTYHNSHLAYSSVEDSYRQI